MLTAYRITNGKLEKMDLRSEVTTAELEGAAWIDLHRPIASQIDAVKALGIDVPTLEEMEEIEISNRIYREGDVDYMTAVIPGELHDGGREAMPVSFIVKPGLLVTVRHHMPRPFTTFPERADRASGGSASAEAVFVGLLEEIIARLADILEGSGRELNRTTQMIFSQGKHTEPEVLQQSLRNIGLEAELMARVRLGLLSIERVLTYYQTLVSGKRADKLKPILKAQFRDVQALEVHLDFLSSRVGLAVDTTMGMINLQQNDIARVLSVMASLFLPPTLIASVFGMNFVNMPELQLQYGYYMALGLMIGTAALTFLILRWKKWL